MKSRFVLALVLSPLCMQSWAATVGSHQYLARKQYLFVQPNASAPAAITDLVPQLGGRVDFDLPRWFVITIPDAAVSAIQQHPAVKYLQQVMSGPFVQPVATTTGLHQITTQGRPAANSFPTNSGDYKYDGAGNISAVGTDTFVYDSLSRIVSASVKGATETYSYDAFGNLTYKHTVNPDPNHPLDVTVDFRNSTSTSTNRLTNYGYDAAGNLIDGTSETNAFDPVNMQREKDVGGLAELYVYNANDERVGTFECSGPPANCYNATVIWSLRDESGKVLRQFEGTYLGRTDGNGNPINDPAWAWTEDYVYRDGLLLASEQPSAEGGRRHFHLDHLGSARLVTGSSGQQMATHDYYPFGVEIAPSFPDTAAGFREEPMRFTGHERDFNTNTTTENENYNDFMHARARNPQWTRFLSVDRHSGDVHNPQTWNRYSYALNNPLSRVDPDGLCSMPASLQPGQIGICVESWIARGLVFGLAGDNRGPVGNDPNATSRMQQQYVADPNKGTVTAFAPLAGSTFLRRGTVDISGPNAVTRRGDFLSFWLHGSGLNAWAAWPFAPHEPILWSINLLVGSHSVGVGAHSYTTAYPSMAIFSYYMEVDGKVTTDLIYKHDETTPADLGFLSWPIPAFDPRDRLFGPPSLDIFTSFTGNVIIDGHPQ